MHNASSMLHNNNDVQWWKFWFFIYVKKIFFTLMTLWISWWIYYVHSVDRPLKRGCLQPFIEWNCLLFHQSCVQSSDRQTDRIYFSLLVLKLYRMHGMTETPNNTSLSCRHVSFSFFTAPETLLRAIFTFCLDCCEKTASDWLLTSCYTFIMVSQWHIWKKIHKLELADLGRNILQMWINGLGFIWRYN